jgi:hypothetical protein
MASKPSVPPVNDSDLTTQAFSSRMLPEWSFLYSFLRWRLFWSCSLALATATSLSLKGFLRPAGLLNDLRTGCSLTELRGASSSSKEPAGMRLRRAKGEAPSVLIAGSLAIVSSLLGRFSRCS